MHEASLTAMVIPSPPTSSSLVRWVPPPNVFQYRVRVPFGIRLFLVTCVVLSIERKQVSQSPIKTFSGRNVTSHPTQKPKVSLSARCLSSQSLHRYSFSQPVVIKQWGVTGKKEQREALPNGTGQDRQTASTTRARRRTGTGRVRAQQFRRSFASFVLLRANWHTSMDERKHEREGSQVLGQRLARLGCCLTPCSRPSRPSRIKEKKWKRGQPIIIYADGVCCLVTRRRRFRRLASRWPGWIPGCRSVI